MTTRKWGEAFLKTGLPLEHITITILIALGWQCEPRYEYSRINQKGEPTYFEIDLIGYAPRDSEGEFNLLIECKYHDEQRFWFFLPCTTEDHLGQYGALSAGGDLETDENVLHYGPYDPLLEKNRKSLISLAPKSLWGANISRHGAREANSVKDATDQLGFGFVPFCLDRLYSFCKYTPEAVVPAIITTARLFRLRPDIRGIEALRQATGPEYIADELPWLWCYYAPRSELLDYNNSEIERWREQHRKVRFRGLDDQLASLWSGPHWIMVVNAGSLAEAATAVHMAFIALPKDFRRNRGLKLAIERSQTRMQSK
ncbi:MAG TPA: hypothetical protein VGY31_17180 [Terriglobia bacterium]|nr:hypothetical protein [Terriglobia bacterium]